MLATLFLSLTEWQNLRKAIPTGRVPKCRRQEIASGGYIPSREAPYKVLGIRQCDAVPLCPQCLRMSANGLFPQKSVV